MPVRIALLLVVLVLILLPLAVAEGALRQGLVRDPAYVPSDGWWREYHARHGRGRNPREFVAIDRELGWIPAADLDSVEYQGVEISTNSDHMRGEDEVLDPAPGLRIVAVGDSYTFGQCAEDEETWPEVLERELPGSEVLNLGVMGYGQGQALLRLRRDGLPHEPDVAVFGFHRSDMQRNLLAFRDYAKPRLVEDGDTLTVTNVPLPDSAELAGGWWPPRVWNYVLMFRDARHAETDAFREELFALSEAIVREMARETREAGAHFVLAFLPQPSSLKKTGDYGWPWMQELCERGSREGLFTCATPVPSFRRIAPDEEARRQHFACHYSPQFHRAVGQSVADVVRSLSTG